ILTRLNNVDGIFSTHLSIEIYVGTVSVPNAANDQLSATTVPNGLLRELAELRKRTPELNSRGLTHLFTDRDLDGTTIGIAYLDSLCDTKNAVGLTESRNVWLDSLVAAHEIGHNFGADHDGDAQGSCASTPSSGYLMAPVVSGTDDFSACSITRMRSKTNGATCITSLPPANVRIASNLGAERRRLAAPFRWELPVSNVGGLDSRNVRAELTLPSQLSIIDAGVIGGSCTSGGGAIECELGDIPGGDVRTIELELSSNVAGSHAVTAQVTADHDANRGNNAGSGTIEVEAPADVSVRLRGPATATANERFTVGFDLTNAAADNVETVTVKIELPAGTTVTSASLSDGVCTNAVTSIECTLTSLGAGLTATGSLSLTTSAAGSTTLHASVFGGYFDTNNANDSDDLVVTVGGAAQVVTQSPPSGGSANASGGGGGGGSMGLLLLLALVPLHRARRRRLKARSTVAM
ncbi:MAG TPA: M12 family metallo-peptidase, partial [Steroidobacteraceae bacterium]|nr:M12 family metallo-peptidase [Steroidobacteraceae bacterium]